VNSEVEGYITDFVSTASFKVDGVTVNASATGVVFVDGTRADLANGARVEVEGTTRGGVLFADRVEIKKRAGADVPEPPQEFELHGAIESVNALNQSFVVHGTPVTIDADTKFQRGSAADLRVGVSVDVRGLVSAGTALRATKIK